MGNENFSSVKVYILPQKFPPFIGSKPAGVDQAEQGGNDFVQKRLGFRGKQTVD